MIIDTAHFFVLVSTSLTHDATVFCNKEGTFDCVVGRRIVVRRWWPAPLLCSLTQLLEIYEVFNSHRSVQCKNFDHVHGSEHACSLQDAWTELGRPCNIHQK
jgi:hypothetical protein